MRRTAFVAVILATLAVAIPASSPGADATAPGGPTAIALDGSVQLAWQPANGATGYAVYRGTNPNAIGTALTPPGGIAATSFVDSTASNGTTYYYAVRSLTGATESVSSLVVSAAPQGRSCGTGNPTVLENCFPGNTGWDVRSTASIAAGGIEGFATAASIDKGGSVALKVNSDDNATFTISVYRTGYYGGAGARLISVIRQVPGVRQPACASSSTTTGLVDCSNWSVSTTLTTTGAWPSGVYVLRIVRDDTGSDNHILLVVRDDARSADLLYGVATTTYQAYNNYGGKSLYDFNSTGNTTVSGTARAVKVSYDRPYEQPRSGLRDWYTRNETALVSWLEQSGYDVAYSADADLAANQTLPLGHRAYVSPGHDEYYSANMRNALTTARDQGVGLFFSGSNAIYWKIRFEAGASGPNRVIVNYKTTQSGGPDPSGTHTGTWRDPNGANQPENALIGQQYVGDNDSVYFPLVVSATEGGDRVYRHTPLSTQPPGSSTTIGSTLVGWEWDARVANGAEPAGVKTLASSPVSGDLLQGNGASTTPGSTTSTVTKYSAASGALVFATGTNHWSRGLAVNAAGAGAPDTRIQQVTTNVFADMGALPQTPATGIVLDGGATGPPAPTGLTAVATGSDQASVSWNAVTGAEGYHVYRALTPRSGGQPLGFRANAALVTGTTFVDTSLNSTTTYYYAVTAVVGGVQSNASADAQVTTPAAAGQPTRMDVGSTTSYTSSTGAVWQPDSAVTGGTRRTVRNAVITGTNDPQIYRTERWGQFTYAIPLSNGTYDVRFHMAELYFGVNVAGGAGKRVFGLDVLDTTQAPDLANIDIFAEVGARAALVKTVGGVRVTDGVLNIRSVYGPADDPTLEGLEIIPISVTPSVTSTVPSDGATGVSRSIHPRATFSRPMDASTITATSFTLSQTTGPAVAGSVSYDSVTQTASFEPATPLAYSTSYTARLATTIKAADGTPLAAPMSWVFTTQGPQHPVVTATTPAANATAVSPSVNPRATFSRSLDAATVTATSFTLSGPGGGNVPATVSYDDTTRTATLTPNASLATGTSYTARLETTIEAFDGVPLEAPFVWTFTTTSTEPTAPTVVDRSPAEGSSGVAPGAQVTATFSTAMDAASIDGASFTLTGPAGQVSATVSYDAGSRIARLTPSAALAFSTGYTARLATTIRASDGTPLAAAEVWSFTVGPPPPTPTVVATSPAEGATLVDRGSVVTATFSRAMDASTITSSSFTLRRPDGTSVPASVVYDAGSATARLTPTSLLPADLALSARVEISVKAADGTPLGAPATWTFTTAVCPCSLFSPTLAPTRQGLAVRDGRPLPGPWSYELGVKLTVGQAMSLTGVRFYKDARETGSHTGRIWSSSGALLATVGFTGETASGWQAATLGTPVALQPGNTYLVSVNANAFFGSTPFGLQSQVVSGPVRSVVGANGVYGSAAGVFPTQSYQSSNYFVDLVAVPSEAAAAPTVTSRTPSAGASGVHPGSTVQATFSRHMNESTINTSSFTLRDAGGNQIAASVVPNSGGDTAVLTPASPLAYATTYTATLAATIRAADGVALASAVVWSFTTMPQPAPLTVTSTNPAAGATGVGRDAVARVTFSRAVDQATLTSSSFRLLGPDSSPLTATISYDAPSLTATLTPTSPLAAGAVHTVEITSGVRAATDNAPLSTPTSWTFTTGACPCSLFSTVLVPASTGNSVRDGRPLPGPWSRELGVKITVTAPAALTAVRFFKDAAETGSHTGTIWTADGTPVATVAFGPETASGWQTATLATPLELQPGTVYVISVNYNATYVRTTQGLLSQISNGPLRSVADGSNGVYGAAAGVFPTDSFQSSNYFVDVVVR